ncbi:hypothetical protein SSX86_029644 [Deinandra increscens subsp. villosa]|uniref:Uncharacterized protein n=1 Tax=Deinandra increscens subsp. villosa TaxID=3103831 RepID=A0AAP0CA01_9ASTR
MGDDSDFEQPAVLTKGRKRARDQTSSESDDGVFVRNKMGNNRKSKRVVVKGMSDEESDDSDFVSKKTSITKKGDKPTSVPLATKIYHQFDGSRIKARLSTSNLTEWFATFSKKQRQAVQSIGFGRLLGIQIHSIPTTLGYWLLHNYNDETSVLCLGQRSIKITPQLVNKLLGVPIGKNLLIEKRTSIKLPVVAEWRGQFKKDPWVSRPYVLGFFDRIKQRQDIGRLFLLNFLVAVMTVMGRTDDNSTVNQGFLHAVTPSVNISQLRWCDYLIDCIKKTKSRWRADNPEMRFNGSLLILAMAMVYDTHQKSKSGEVDDYIRYINRNQLISEERSDGKKENIRAGDDCGKNITEEKSTEKITTDEDPPAYQQLDDMNKHGMYIDPTQEAELIRLWKETEEFNKLISCCDVSPSGNHLKLPILTPQMSHEGNDDHGDSSEKHLRDEDDVAVDHELSDELNDEEPSDDDMLLNQDTSDHTIDPDLSDVSEY